MESEITQPQKVTVEKTNENTKDMEIDDDDKDTNNKSSKFLKRGRIFIRNLPFSVTEEKLRTLFSKFGEIKELNLPYDQVKKMFKGFCFLQYEIKKEALVAIKKYTEKTSTEEN